MVRLQTDGLSDNVYPTELISICSLVSRQYAHSRPPLPPADRTEQAFKFIHTEEDAQVQTIAERIVNYAQLCMKNKKRASPFERAAAREGMYFRGGVSALKSEGITRILNTFVVLRKWMSTFLNWSHETGR